MLKLVPVTLELFVSMILLGQFLPTNITVTNVFFTSTQIGNVGIRLSYVITKVLSNKMLPSVRIEEVHLWDLYTNKVGTNEMGIGMKIKSWYMDWESGNL